MCSRDNRMVQQRDLVRLLFVPMAATGSNVGIIIRFPFPVRALGQFPGRERTRLV